MVWSAAGSSAPDKFHTTHDAITSTHFSSDDRLVVMGTQVRCTGDRIAADPACQ